MTELTAPRLHVTLADGQQWWVDTGNQDLVAWDMTAMKHKWPGPKDAPFLWSTFIAWHASRRRGLLPDPGMTWDQFRTAADGIEGPDSDEPPAGDESVGMVASVPTQPEPVPG